MRTRVKNCMILNDFFYEELTEIVRKQENFTRKVSEFLSNSLLMPGTLRGSMDEKIFSKTT